MIKGQRYCIDHYYKFVEENNRQTRAIFIKQVSSIIPRRRKNVCRKPM